MAVLTASPSSAPLLLHNWRSPPSRKCSMWSSAQLQRRGLRVKAFFFNPVEEPILKEALKEPIAFMGGMFAGLMRLDVNEEPLKEWVVRMMDASGITEEEISVEDSKSEDTPQQIEIE